MSQYNLSFLKSLSEAPSPSGYEMPAQRIVRAEIKEHACEIDTDPMGNVLATVLAHEESPRKVLLCGHCDEVGFLAKGFTTCGKIIVTAVGGIDSHLTPGLRVEVHTKDKVVNGIIGRKAIHALTEDERKRVTPLSKQFVDCGFKDKEEAEKAISIGDPITFAKQFEELGDNTLCMRGADDKVGVFIVNEVLKNYSREENRKLSLTAASTVQEEIGLRGARTAAYTADPDVCIAVDVTLATDFPGMDINEHGDVKLGSGPVLARGPNVNHALFDILVETAKENDIPIQIEAEPRSLPTDLNSVQVSRGGVATAMVSIPTRYLHSPVECLNKADIDHAINLITAALAKIGKKATFAPE